MNNISGLNELKTFGYSVSGGVDVDNNQFNGTLIMYIHFSVHNVQKFLTIIIMYMYIICMHGAYTCTVVSWASAHSRVSTHVSHFKGSM